MRFLAVYSIAGRVETSKPPFGWHRQKKSAEAELLQDLIESEAVMSHDFAQNGAQGAGAERVMVGDGQMMFAGGLGGQAVVGAACLGVRRHLKDAEWPGWMII